MTTTRFTPFGVIVEFNHNEVIQIKNRLNTGAGAAAAFAGLLYQLGISGSATAVLGVGFALLKTSVATLDLCNSKQNGIFLHVLWVGPFWCKSR